MAIRAPDGANNITFLNVFKVIFVQHIIPQKKAISHWGLLLRPQWDIAFFGGISCQKEHKALTYYRGAVIKSNEWDFVFLEEFSVKI